MKAFALKISTPEGDVFSGEVLSVSVRGAEGDLAVMAGHIPFVSPIKPCDCKITLEDGTEKIGHTDGGILTVSAEKTVILTGSFAWN
ncbi:MAG: F0F1 ATP synthase subunit epsilon [Clostridia bacterium]|nr:F0F1 ATP synthase subunit epsilon [Clostridia bacterium]MBQ5808800.1 F0F1 ATP synthase subunit epsilon [Clostridia bacterium]